MLFAELFDKLFDIYFWQCACFGKFSILGPNPVKSEPKWQSKQPPNQLSEFKNDASDLFFNAKTWIARHGEKIPWFSITDF